MGIAILKIKVMPEQNSDLEQIKKEIKEKIEAVKGQIDKIEEQEVAFGLKALVVTLTWPEEQETEIAEKAIREVEGVSSLDIIDYRRAFG